MNKKPTESRTVEQRIMLPKINLHCLLKKAQVKNEQLINDINYVLIALRNDVKKRKIPENENPEKTINIVEKILNFNSKKR